MSKRVAWGVIAVAFLSGAMVSVVLSLQMRVTSERSLIGHIMFEANRAGIVADEAVVSALRTLGRSARFSAGEKTLILFAERCLPDLLIAMKAKGTQ